MGSLPLYTLEATCLPPRLWQVATATSIYPVCHRLPAANGTQLGGWQASELPHPPGRVWTWGDGQKRGLGKAGEALGGPGRRGDTIADFLWDGICQEWGCPVGVPGLGLG